MGYQLQGIFATAIVETEGEGFPQHFVSEPGGFLLRVHAYFTNGRGKALG